MKFDFKLNSDMPTQHLAILGLGGVMVLMSLIGSLKGNSNAVPEQQMAGTYAQTGQTKYKNPELTWYEKYLCRGYQRSIFCGNPWKHPFKAVADDMGIAMPEAPPKRTGVIRYRGPMPQSKSLGGKIVLDNFD